MPDSHQPPKPPPVDLEALHSRWAHDKKSRLFLQLAEEYRKQGFVDSALEVLKEGLQRHASWIPAKVALARCHMAKNQLAEAQGELERIHAKHPDNLLAGRLLADVHEERGQQGKALKVLRDLVPFAPDDAELAEHLVRLEEAVAPPVPTGEHAAVDTAELHTAEFAARQAAALPGVVPAVRAPARTPGPLDAEPLVLDAEPGEPLELDGADVVGGLAETTLGPAGTTAEMGPAGTTADMQPAGALEPLDESPLEETVRLESSPLGAGPLDLGEPPPETVLLPAGGPLDLDEPEEQAATVMLPAGVATPRSADETFDELAEESAEETAAAVPAKPLPRPAGPAPGNLLGPAPRKGAAGEDEDEFASVTLAELYESQGAHAEAAAIYERLLGRRPGDQELARALARCKTRMAGGDPDSALVAAVSAPSTPLKKPRWEPVRPREPAPADAPAATPAAAPSLGAPPLDLLGGPGAAPPLGPDDSDDELVGVAAPSPAAPAAAEPTSRRAAPSAGWDDARRRRVLADLQRWLDAARAVRQ